MAHYRHLSLLAVLSLTLAVTAPTRLAAVAVITVSSGGNIQTAINQISSGGIIQIASGTYVPPVGGFDISTPGKSFTMRALPAATVVIDGGGTRSLLYLHAVNPTPPGPVVFEGLIFRNGRSTTNGLAGGVTVSAAEATFVDCVFEDSVGNQPSSSTGGGGVALFNAATAAFVGCRFEGNSARSEGGGLRVSDGSAAYLHDGYFLNNRTNLPGHRTTSAGGAIYVGNATLRATNTRFEDNQTGYAGGAVYIIGTWTNPVSVPRSDVVIANSTFENNVSVPDPGVTPPGPTEGGGLHAEDQSTVQVYNTRFLLNRSDNGGGLNLYRAIVEVEDSVFRGNRAVGSGSNGRGGAIQSISNDTTADGATNRRTAQLTVRRSTFQGVYGGTTVNGLDGGCIDVIGDTNRNYGLAGVSQMGTSATNRGQLVIEDSIFYDCDVELDPVTPAGTSIGGAINVSLGDLTMSDSLILESDALGTGAQGGGLRVVQDSDASVAGCTFARNSAGTFGGALSVQGSNIDVGTSNFIHNEVSPGVSEPINDSFGAAIFTGPQADAFALPVTGTIHDNVISLSTGLPIYEGDRHNGPINDVRYNSNTIFNTTFGADIFRNGLTGPQTVAELNVLTVVRSGAPDTVKSQINNMAPGSAPVVGAIVAAPPAIFALLPPDDPGLATESYLGYAWSGGTATLDGGTVTGNAGFLSDGIGVHTLSVSGQPFLATIDNGAEPSASLGASPGSIPPGGSSTLNWSSSGGGFLEARVDRGVAPNAGAAGSSSVSPPCDATYTYCVVTRAGGAVARTTVTVGAVPFFTDGFESGNTSAWQLTSTP